MTGGAARRDDDGYAQRTPPFRADHVGSLLRPQRLLAARDDRRRRHASTRRSCGRSRTQAIPEVVARQQEAGLQSATDGEFRRASWHMDFIYQLGGISKAPGNLAVKFRNAAGNDRVHPCRRCTSAARSGWTETIFADDFGFLAVGRPAARRRS